MHQLPLDGTCGQRHRAAEGAEAISLAGLDAYYPLYARNKPTAALLEFCLNWACAATSRKHRSKPQAGAVRLGAVSVRGTAS